MRLRFFDYGVLFDQLARRIHFRSGIIISQVTLLLVIIVGLLMFFMTHELLESHKETADDTLTIVQISDGIRTHFFEWQNQMITLRMPGGSSSQKKEADDSADAISMAINSELKWYSEHSGEGVDYPAQLQEIATGFARLRRLQQQMVIAVSPSGSREAEVRISQRLLKDGRDVEQMMIGLIQQQLYGIQQHFEEEEIREDVLFSVGSLSIIAFGVVAVLLLTLVQRASYLHAKSNMDVIDYWAHSGFTLRVVDPELLKKVPSEGNGDKFSRHYPFSMLAHNINYLGDVMQIFLLESQASLEAMAAGNTERRIQHEGFPWMLKKVAIDINANIDRVVEIYMRADQDQVNLNDFQRDLSIISQSLGAVADSMGMNGMELMDASHLMEDRVQTTEQEAGRVQQSMGQASQAVDAISQSISDVAGQVREASVITSEAVEQAHETRTTIAQLERASGNIGNMVELITTIARQTQMLSMNATIEAARAGEAGRGFAVVASEVKELATQTSSAAQDISASIEEIQGTTEVAMVVIQKVAETIERIHAITKDIECNAIQQEHAAKGIASNVAQANHATTVMGDNLKEVRTAADRTNSNVETMNTAAQELKQSMDELDGVVKSYIGEAESDDIELF